MCYQEVILNGSTVPGVREPAKDIQILLNQKMTDKKILVIKAKRLPKTRAVLHTHKSGGVTCVLSGELTLYMEGSEPQNAKANTCYYMDPDKKMLSYNNGDSDAEFIDFFNVKNGDRALTPLECDFTIKPGNPYTDIQKH